MTNADATIYNSFSLMDIQGLPDKWELKKIGEFSREIKEKNSDGIEDVVSVTKHKGIVPSLSYFKNRVFSENLSNYKVIRKGQFAYATIHLNEGSIGYLACYNNAVLSPMYTVFEIDNLTVNNYFLLNLLKTDRALKIYERITPGGVQRRGAIRYTEFSKLNIPLPPLPEQQKIASVLSTIQEAKEKTENVIRANKELKKSMMKHLFTYGAVPVEDAERVPLKETEVGMIPEHWEERKLEDLCEIVYGVQAAVAHLIDKSTGIPILTNINIKNDGYIDLSTLRYYNLPESKRQKLLLKKGDILFNWRSGSKAQVGKTALFSLDDDFTFSSFILRFRVNEEIQNAFLVHYLHNLKDNGFFSAKGDQSSVNAVFNASLSAKIPVSLPPFLEQEAIAEALSAIDKKLESEENKKQALESLFKTLLSLLMTGKLRVKDLEISV